MKNTLLGLAFVLLSPLGAQMILTVDRTAPPDVQWAWALYQGDVEWVEELIAKGFKVNKKLGEIKHHQSGTILGGSGEYPIQVAVKGGGPDMIRYLAKKGANLGVKDPEGQSLIHLAYNRPRALAALIELKVNPLAQDAQGNTVLHIAIGIGKSMSEERDEVVGLLKGQKKLLTIKNKKGRTAVEQALHYHNRRAVELLAVDRLPELEKNIAVAKAKEEAEEKTKKEQFAKIDMRVCGQRERLTASDVLIKAVNDNDRKLLACVLQKAPTLANYRSCAKEGELCETRPHVAFDFSRDELIEAVIDGSSKEKLDADSYLGNMATALLFHFNGKAVWFKKLKAKGVRLDVRNGHGKSPQMYACEKSGDDVVAIVGADAGGQSYKAGQKVWVQGLSEGTVMRSCSHGAVLFWNGKKSFTAANMIRSEPQAFLTQKKDTNSAIAKQSAQDALYEANYRKHKQQIDLLRKVMARLSHQIVAVENEMAVYGETPTRYEKSSVTGYKCDVNQQNCRATTQGGGSETVLSQWRRIENRDAVRKLQLKHSELVSEYDKFAREHDKLLTGKP